jgi:hypothetical protein
MFADHLSSKGLISKMLKNLNSTVKKQRILFKRGKEAELTLIKDDTEKPKEM